MTSSFSRTKSVSRAHFSRLTSPRSIRAQTQFSAANVEILIGHFNTEPFALFACIREIYKRERDDILCTRLRVEEPSLENGQIARRRVV